MIFHMHTQHFHPPILKLNEEHGVVGMDHELGLLTFLQGLKSVGHRSINYLVMTQTHMTDLGQAYPSVVHVAVGSPGAEDYGQSDVKTVKCAANSGFFTITLRGQTTVPINAAVATVESFIKQLEDISSIGSIEAVEFAKTSM